MRVAFVSMGTTHTRDTWGRRRFERVARLLAQRGHDVTVFCARWWDSEARELVNNGVTYRAVTDSPSASKFAMRLPTALASHRPDVVHTRVDPAIAVLGARTGAALARAPLVAEWYGEEDLSNSRHADRVARTPDMIVTPSEMVRTEVRERGATAENSRVIPDSIDMSLIRETDPSFEIDVVYAHPLVEGANVENLLLGLAELRDRDWSATVIGDGPRRDDYERQAADLRINDRVTFVGACDRAERLAIYRGAHAFVQTAARAYFATELLWAMACGCVGIVEYQAESSAHELVENYERSYRVTNPQQIADAIVDAGEFDRWDIDEDWSTFDHGPVVDQYVSLYERLVEEHGFF